MITFSSISRVGDRDNNEDAYIIGKNKYSSFFVLADGLGGHGHGEEASAMVVNTIQNIIENAPIMPLNMLVDSSIAGAQERLIDEQKRRGMKNEMKTTVVLLCCSEKTLCWGNVGDSRLYAFYKNKIKQRTLDHSIPQMLVLSGELSERKIRNHPQRNILLRVLGIEWDRPRHEVSELMPVSDYQAFLLCSDGFWELINEHKMLSCLRKSKTVEEWLERMTTVVEKNGSKKDMDNYTAIAIWINNE